MSDKYKSGFLKAEKDCRDLEEKLHAAEKKITELEKEIEDYQDGWLSCCHTCEPVAIKNKAEWQPECDFLRLKPGSI